MDTITDMITDTIKDMGVNMEARGVDLVVRDMEIRGTVIKDTEAAQALEDQVSSACCYHYH